MTLPPCGDLSNSATDSSVVNWQLLVLACTAPDPSCRISVDCLVCYLSWMMANEEQRLADMWAEQETRGVLMQLAETLLVQLKQCQEGLTAEEQAVCGQAQFVLLLNQAQHNVAQLDAGQGEAEQQGGEQWGAEQQGVEQWEGEQPAHADGIEQWGSEQGEGEQPVEEHTQWLAMSTQRQSPLPASGSDYAACCILTQTTPGGPKGKRTKQQDPPAGWTTWESRASYERVLVTPCIATRPAPPSWALAVG